MRTWGAILLFVAIALVRAVPIQNQSMLETEKGCKKNVGLSKEDGSNSTQTAEKGIYCWAMSPQQEAQLEFCPNENTCITQYIISNPFADAIGSVLETGCLSKAKEQNKELCGAVLCPSEHYVFASTCCQGDRCNDPTQMVPKNLVSAKDCIFSSKHGCIGSQDYNFCAFKDRCVQSGGFGAPCDRVSDGKEPTIATHVTPAVSAELDASLVQITSPQTHSYEPSDMDMLELRGFMEDINRDA